MRIETVDDFFVRVRSNPLTTPAECDAIELAFIVSALVLENKEAAKRGDREGIRESLRRAWELIEEMGERCERAGLNGDDPS